MKTLFPSLLAVAAGFGLSRLTATGSSGDESAVSESPGITKIQGGAGPPPRAAPAPQPDTGTEAPPTWQSAAKAWMEADPAGFYRWLVKRGIPPDGRVNGDLFRAWGKKDPEAAMQAGFNLPPDFNRGVNVLDMVLNTVIDQPGGLEKVLRWAPAAEEQLTRWGWFKAAWVKSAPPEEIGALLAKSASGEKYTGDLTGYFAEYWASQNLTDALAWMRSLPAGLKARGCEGIMTQWAKTDPAAALEYLANQATTTERGQAMDALAALAKTDPKAAVEWGDQNLGLADYNSMTRIFESWCAADSKEARDYVLTIEDPELRKRALSSWGDSAEVKDLQSAVAGMAEGRDRRTLIDSLSNQGGSDEAMAFIRREMEKGSPSISPTAALYVSRIYTYQGAEAAFAWAAALPENLQATAVRGVLDNWKNKVAAAQAIEQLPDGSLKTAAREALGKNLTNSFHGDEP